MKNKLLFSVFSLMLICSSCSEDDLSGNSAEGQVAILSFDFTAAQNGGKIMAKRLYYKPDTYTSYTTNPSETTWTMTVTQDEITGCIPYLFDKVLVPTIEYTPGSEIQYSNDGGNKFAVWDGKSAIDFNECDVIRISKSGIKQDYKINIVNSGLPVVVINQPDGNTDWAQTGEKVFSKSTDFDLIEDNYPGNITVYQADGTIDVDGAVSMTRLRGNTTQSFPKKPFAVKLGEKTEILGMPKHKRWVLLANWKDKSLMRNHIALGIARKFTELCTDGIPWNVNGCFVELIYNGVHVGNYYLCEQIKIDENRLNINSEYDPDDYPSLTQEQLGNFGYLLECDDNYDEDTKFVTKHYIPFQFKDDCDDGDMILNYVREKVQGIEDCLYDGFKNNNELSYEKAYAELDLPSVIDQLLIYEMTMNSEFGHPKSVYMYIDGMGKLCAGPVWDFDWLAFPINNEVLKRLNNGWDRGFTQSLMATAGFKNHQYVSETFPLKPRSDDVPFLWYPMMITETTFQNLAASRWQKMLPVLTTYAEEIHRTGEKIALSWEYNNAIWPAYYSANSDRQKYCNGGYCGDEEMTSLSDICTALYHAYMERLDGMRFVIDKDWPIWKIE